MKLHENKDEFRAAIIETATALNLPEHIIEKDYWVTKLLYNLYNYQHKIYIIFKGGTSLSKGHGLISRFSEDIDLALHPDGVGDGKIHRKEGEALHRVLKKIKDSNFTDVASARESEGQRYKRIYAFPQNFDYPEDSPIHGKIVVEINSFSIPTPTEDVEIKSFISEYLQKKYGEKILEELDMKPFVITALMPERAFCEKLLALRRAGHNGGDFFAERIRHVYDIHQLYNATRIKKWLSDETKFFEMLQACYRDDELNKKISNEVAPDFQSYDTFNNPRIKLETVRTAYERLRDLTFDKKIPNIDEVSKVLTEINKILIKFKFIV